MISALYKVLPTKFFFPIVFAFLGLLLFSSCATGIAALGIAYTVETNRLPTDDLASVILDKDCDFLRKKEKGDAWCRDRNTEKSFGSSQPPIWCYRSLGDVACYDRPIEDESAQLVR